jgi:putative heme-binding domain-containing protein
VQDRGALDNCQTLFYNCHGELLVLQGFMVCRVGLSWERTVRATPRLFTGRFVIRFLLLGCTAFPSAIGQIPRTQPGPNGRSDSRNLARTVAPARSLKIPKDFRVELVYSVPKDEQGSWINLSVAPNGRLIASDQNGSLYRITPSVPGGTADETKVEKLDLSLGGAHGLLYAFDSLYVMVNEPVEFGGVKPRPGLYRARSKDGGQTFEPPELLHEVKGRGEHGPHAILLGPDASSLYIVCGNETDLVAPLARSRVPMLWGEDRLLPVVAGYSGVRVPAGCVYKVDRDGRDWELWSAGLRNPFDAAFNRQGDLFSFDSDMEGDMNTPWYRPTRVCLVTSGSDFGFRDGSNNSPSRYIDTVPAVFDVGPASPTGMTFGYGARFPARYQEALFLCDWVYGKMYAVHLACDGSSYKAEAEEFLGGAPLPLTDVVVNPKDGALYFTVGGRFTQSGLYRVTYAGEDSTAPTTGGPASGPLHSLRRKLEAFHGRQDPKAVQIAWPCLDHADRSIRFAARVAVEHQELNQWEARALGETNPAAAINALLALVRVVGEDPLTHPRKASDAVPGVQKKASLLAALERIDWGMLSDRERCDLLRVYTVLFSHLGGPDRATRDRLIRLIDPRFPSESIELNADLCQLLVYLESPSVAEKALKLMDQAPSQEEQIEYAKSLRCLKSGWSLEQRKAYFAWYQTPAVFKGLPPFPRTMRQMQQDAVATLTRGEAQLLKPFLETKSPVTAPPGANPRRLVRQWNIDELAPVVERGLTRRNFDRGRRLFGEAQCFACHHFDNQGGSLAPDLTMISRRYSVRDLVEKVLDPSKAIGDQYRSVIIATTDGVLVSGRIVNYQGDTIMLVTNLLDPSGVVEVSASKVESIERSQVSMMPRGLLDTFKQDEILDLLAYLLSGGDRSQRMFLH